MMTSETLDICGTALAIKEYSDQRVVTFKDIDMVHGRSDGTASRNFRSNRHRFIEGEDFYKISPDEIRRSNLFDIPDKATSEYILLTEQGYLMLVKSFTDDLAWRVQRELVNSYFKREKKQHTLSADYALKLAELINSTPPGNMPIIREIFAQAGITIPEVRTIPPQETHGITDFLQSINVVGRVSGDVYAEYKGWCIANNLNPMAHIAFSKVVNKTLGTHIVPKRVDRICRRVFVH